MGDSTASYATVEGGRRSLENITVPRSRVCQSSFVYQSMILYIHVVTSHFTTGSEYAFIWHTNMMHDENLIDDLIGFKIEDNGSDGTGLEMEDEDEVHIVGQDKDAEMMQMVRSIKMMMESMDRRMGKLEVEVATLKKESLKPRHRDTFAMPNPDAHRHTPSPIFKSKNSEASVTRDGDTESFTNVSRSRSEIGGPTVARTQASYMHGFMGPGVFAGASGTKSKSALASKGYNSKTELWGVGFASMMYACMKRYMQFTEESGHTVDGLQMMKTYSGIVDVLYNRIKAADLPAVQSETSHFMASSFSRSGPDSLPDSVAEDWWELSQHRDGIECMSVIESIFLAAKMVPEAMVHPISQLIAQMGAPAVKMTPKGPAFSIPTTTKVCASPSGYEAYCRCLKKAALKTYVRYRLEGMNELQTVSKMSMTMRDTEMFDKR